jgi:hypothetical protein
VQTDRLVVPVVAHRSDAEAATDGARWVTRWRGWADWPLSLPLLALAAFAVALDVTTAWTGTALGSLGRIATSPALPLALLLAAWVGAGRVGLSRERVRAWREYALAVGVVLALATVGYAVAFGRPAEAIGLVVAALGEELVYRFAAVIVFGALAARLLGRPWRNPRDWGTAPGLLGLAAAAVLFSALPGHVVQVTGPSTSVAFASLALVLGYTVLRTGTVWPAVMAHALLNLTAIATWQTAGPQGLRVALAATVLVSLVAAADVAGRRLGLRRRVPTVIDLSRTSAPVAS